MRLSQTPSLSHEQACLTPDELKKYGATDEDQERTLRGMPLAELASVIMCCHKSEIHALPEKLEPFTRTWLPADALRVVQEQRWTSEHGPMISRQASRSLQPCRPPYLVALARALFRVPRLISWPGPLRGAWRQEAALETVQ